ncbi:uncharacterized protein CIMG_02175 [Coccidioides immitis RS]|uniref:Uncharacterized protein n=1 Tax=Coccidioides immitis (strain RS) TaxID=246410 RepID=J3KKT5_COCIM|nr:uncharacterized protein CIMG_02175 [Coccidioides immitis RS]EAS36821.3 hypothetical protein CIMG_02175 [Coccidioides immitis RS]
MIYLTAKFLLLGVFVWHHIPHPTMKILFCGFRLTFLMMLMLAALITCLRMTKGNLPDAETTPLLASQGSQNQSCEPQGIHEPSTKNHLLAVLIFFKTMFHFFWPSGRPRFQLLYLPIRGSLVAEQAVNIMMPIQLGLMTDMLAKPNGTFPWEKVMAFMLLQWLVSSLPTLRGLLWAPLDNYSYQEISTTAFNHIMSLSCDFHDKNAFTDLGTTIMHGRLSYHYY